MTDKMSDNNVITLNRHEKVTKLNLNEQISNPLSKIGQIYPGTS